MWRPLRRRRRLGRLQRAAWDEGEEGEACRRSGGAGSKASLREEASGRAAAVAGRLSEGGGDPAGEVEEKAGRGERGGSRGSWWVQGSIRLTGSVACVCVASVSMP